MSIEKAEKIKFMVLESWKENMMADAVKWHKEKITSDHIANAYRGGYEQGFSDAIKALQAHKYIEVVDK